MTELVQQITPQGLQLTREVLEACGLYEGESVRIAPTPSGVLIRPAELSAREITGAAVRYLLHHVGDHLAVCAPVEMPDGWEVRVVLRPDLQELGRFRFDRLGTLLTAQSSSVEELTAAADAA